MLPSSLCSCTKSGCSWSPWVQECKDCYQLIPTLVPAPVKKITRGLGYVGPLQGRNKCCTFFKVGALAAFPGEPWKHCSRVVSIGTASYFGLCCNATIWTLNILQMSNPSVLIQYIGSVCHLFLRLPWVHLYSDKFKTFVLFTHKSCNCMWTTCKNDHGTTIQTLII